MQVVSVSARSSRLAEVWEVARLPVAWQSLGVSTALPGWKEDLQWLPAYDGAPGIVDCEEHNWPSLGIKVCCDLN